MANNKGKRAGNPASEENQWLKVVLLALLVLVPLGAVGMIVAVVNAPAVTVAASQAAGGQAAGGQTPAQSPGGMGLFDNNAAIAVYGRYLLATVIFIAAAVLEMFLIILYGAMFVNDPVNRGRSLGLPNATVRVFLLGIVVLITLIFTVLPDTWGNNKAVVLLFGFLATVMGFYFGSRANADPGDTPAQVHLTLDSGTTQVKNAPTPIGGKLAPTFLSVLGTPLPPVLGSLQDSSGSSIGTSRAAVDSSGRVEFDFDEYLNDATPGRSYLVHIVTPSSVTCDDRITVKVPDSKEPSAPPSGPPPSPATVSSNGTGDHASPTDTQKTVAGPASTSQPTADASAADAKPSSDSSGGVATATLEPLAITTPELAAAQTNVPYSAQLEANGGKPPYTWTVEAGTPPPNVFLDAQSGKIEGTPSGPGQPFTVKVQDADNTTATAALNISVS